MQTTSSRTGLSWPWCYHQLACVYHETQTSRSKKKLNCNISPEFDPLSPKSANKVVVEPQGSTTCVQVKHSSECQCVAALALGGVSLKRSVKQRVWIDGEMLSIPAAECLSMLAYCTNIWVRVCVPCADQLAHTHSVTAVCAFVWCSGRIKKLFSLLL